MEKRYARLTIVILTFIGCSAFADNSAFKRGESAFFAYCSGCHSLKYTSYPKLAMPESEAIKWFGVLPPDLSLSAKYRGPQWLHAYLQGFYPDASRPYGCNNNILPNVQMPNVLFPLRATNNYDQTIDDLIVFLTKVSDPTITKRHDLGLYVLGFCIILSAIIGAIYRNNKGT